MRLTEKEKTTLISEIQKADPQAVIYLFGSRTQDHLKGGDIDLLVLSTKIDFSAKIEILGRIKLKLGEQKIDLKIISPEKSASDPFTQSLLPGAIRLG